MEHTRYEYKTAKVSRAPKARDRELTAYGRQGWEVTETKDLWQKTVTVSMRRPFTSVPSEPQRKGFLARLLGL